MVVVDAKHEQHGHTKLRIDAGSLPKSLQRVLNHLSCALGKRAMAKDLFQQCGKTSRGAEGEREDVADSSREKEISARRVHANVTSCQGTLSQIAHNAEVNDNWLASSLSEHDIRRFQIAVDQVIRRDMADGLDQDGTQIQHCIATERAGTE